MSTASISYQTVQRGALHGPDFRLYTQTQATDGSNFILSPFHDIPMYSNEKKREFNMVVEIPRWTNAKMEINIKEELNPIKQDTVDDRPRFVANCFPYKGYIWNYGAIPQTWEDPEHVDQHTQCKGDGDPIDVCEIGHKLRQRGEVVPIKVLGTVALIDSNETDWKILAISTDDPLANQLQDVTDIQQHMPGLLEATVNWFKIYKVPENKPLNTFAFNGEAKNRHFAEEIICQLHKQWVNLMASDKSPEKVSRTCTVYDCSSKVDQTEARKIVDSKSAAGADLGVDSRVDDWHHVRSKYQ